MKRLFKKQRLLKSILSLKVDFSAEFKEKLGELKSGKPYYLGNKEEKISYENIRAFLIETIEVDMKKSLDKITDLDILKITVEDEYSGSIELVLSIVFGAFSVMSGYKSFYDNITLISNQSRKFISRKLKNKYGMEFFVGTTIEYPTIERFHPEELFFRFAKRGFFPFPLDTQTRNFSTSISNHYYVYIYFLANSNFFHR